MPILPAPHPVFDKVADRFGFLSALDAYGVSRIYNVVTGLRLILTGVSSQGFLDAGDEIQVARLVYIANTMERELPAARLIVDRLQRVSRQSLWCWIGGCDDRT
jgi:hypothetical protein